jgi:hypothetical protein
VIIRKQQSQRVAYFFCGLVLAVAGYSLSAVNPGFIQSNKEVYVHFSAVMPLLTIAHPQAV